MEERFAEKAVALAERKTLRCVVRVRPLQRHESQQSSALRVLPDRKTLHALIGAPDAADSARAFSFDFVANPTCSQADFFTEAGVPDLIDASLAGGLNVSIFAYGQTGSGKTFTMSGPNGGVPPAGSPVDASGLSPTSGLIPRALTHLFSRLNELAGRYGPAGERRAPVVRLACAEVYCEGVYDLLAPGGGSLPVRYAPGAPGACYVQGQVVLQVTNVHDVLDVLAEANANRSVASHALNHDSSRSHAVVTLFIEQLRADSDSGIVRTVRSKILFVDLAGSERLKESMSEGVTAVETRQINTSLFTLGKVIAALADKSSRKVERAQAQAHGSAESSVDPHIPYRDSKLTQILQDSLGGTALTLMLSCLTPAALYLEESLNTLQYALRASRIENAPVVRLDSKDSALTKLRTEAALLRAENTIFRTQLALPQTGAVTDEMVLSALEALVASLTPKPVYVPVVETPRGLPMRKPKAGAVAGGGRARPGAGNKKREEEGRSGRLVAGSVASGGGPGSVSGGESIGSGGGLELQAAMAVAGIFGPPGGAGGGGSSFTSDRAADRASRQLVLDAQQAEIAALTSESAVLRKRTLAQRARIGALTTTMEDHRASIDKLQAELAAARRAQNIAETAAHNAMGALSSNSSASSPSTTHVHGFGIGSELVSLRAEVDNLRQANSLLELRLKSGVRQGSISSLSALLPGRTSHGTNGHVPHTVAPPSPPTAMPSYSGGPSPSSEGSGSGSASSGGPARSAHHLPQSAHAARRLVSNPRGMGMGMALAMSTAYDEPEPLFNRAIANASAHERYEDGLTRQYQGQGQYRQIEDEQGDRRHTPESVPAIVSINRALPHTGRSQNQYSADHR